MAVPFFLLSVYCTVSGTDKFLSHRKMGAVPVQEKFLHQKDSLMNHYEMMIKEEETRLQTLRKEAKETRTLKWKSTLQSLAFREKIIQGLMQEKTALLSNLKSNFQNRSQTEKLNFQSIQKHMVAIAFGMESLLLLSLIFITLYQYKISRETDFVTDQKFNPKITEAQKEAREIISNYLEVAQMLKAGKSYKEIRKDCGVGSSTITKVNRAVGVLGY
jgi:hypothetical protein